MHCYYHPNRNVTGYCSHCKKPLCDQCTVSEGDQSFTCIRCVALKAEQDASRGIDQRRREKRLKVQIQEAGKHWKRKTKIAFQIVILVIGLTVIVINMHGLRSGFKKDKPLRNGIYQTDAQADQCIRNLWQIARMLQEGELPGKNILCPASKMPYVVSYVEGDIVVRSPDPGLYGFKEIQVSKRRPVPEVIR